MTKFIFRSCITKVWLSATGVRLIKTGSYQKSKPHWHWGTTSTVVIYWILAAELAVNRRYAGFDHFANRSGAASMDLVTRVRPLAWWFEGKLLGNFFGLAWNPRVTPYGRESLSNEKMAPWKSLGGVAGPPIPRTPRVCERNIRSRRAGERCLTRLCYF